MKPEYKIMKEKQVIEIMIGYYCRKKHGSKSLCGKCSGLLDYAHDRLTSCQFGELKASCRSCSIHCFSGNMRDRIREVMRFSGPRMLFMMPKYYFKHLHFQIFKKRF